MKSDSKKLNQLENHDLKSQLKEQSLALKNTTSKYDLMIKDFNEQIDRFNSYMNTIGKHH